MINRLPLSLINLLIWALQKLSVIADFLGAQAFIRRFHDLYYRLLDQSAKLEGWVPCDYQLPEDFESKIPF